MKDDMKYLYLYFLKDTLKSPMFYVLNAFHNYDFMQTPCKGNSTALIFYSTEKPIGNGTFRRHGCTIRLDPKPRKKVWKTFILSPSGITELSPQHYFEYDIMGMLDE